MIQDTPANPNPAQPVKCTTVEKLLVEVTSQFDRMTALNLGDLKTKVSAAATQKQKNISDYATAYPGLRTRWCTENQSVEKLHQTLICTFKDGSWKKLIQACVCPARAALASLTAEIATKTNCSKGTLELAAANALAARDAAAALRDAWVGAATSIDAQLTANDALIKSIQTQLNAPDQSTAVYQFWFKLLPAHVSIMPDNLGDGVSVVGKGETPEELCGGSAPSRRPPPWLIDPAKFGEALDCAWQDYFAAQKKYADAQAALQEAPDDLATKATTLTAKTASLDADIAACLATQSSPGSTCAPTSAAPTVGA
jgi:hypothetical protein